MKLFCSISIVVSLFFLLFFSIVFEKDKLTFFGRKTTCLIPPRTYLLNFSHLMQKKSFIVFRVFFFFWTWVCARCWKYVTCNTKLSLPIWISFNKIKSLKKKKNRKKLISGFARVEDRVRDWRLSWPLLLVATQLSESGLCALSCHSLISAPLDFVASGRISAFLLASC